GDALRAATRRAADLAGAAVRHERAAVAAGGGHQVGDDQRPAQGRDQGVAVEVERVGAQRGQAVVLGELLPRVDHLRLHRAAGERPLADDLHVLPALADVDRDRDHLGAGALGQVRDGHGGVQTSGVGEDDPLGHDCVSSDSGPPARAGGTRPVQADNVVTNSSPVTGSRTTTRIVSSPAMVPTPSGRPDRSRALARNCAPPGGVRSTARLPLASASVSSSRSSRTSRAGARPAAGGAAGRGTGSPSSGMTYTAPPAVRTFTAPSSSRSRDSVAWVTCTPCAASSSASSVWERTLRERTSSTIRACRAALVTTAPVSPPPLAASGPAASGPVARAASRPAETASVRLVTAAPTPVTAAPAATPAGPSAPAAGCPPGRGRPRPGRP